MQPLLLVRPTLISKLEMSVAKRHFEVQLNRTACAGRLVIGRYSIEPFYEELADDLRHIGSRLINSVDEHRWIASFAYYDEVKAFTPRTWREEEFAACRNAGPFVVKGKLKSKKLRWKTQMFAPTKRDATRLAHQLKEWDADLREQGVVFREYVPLRTFEVGAYGLPIANEWRFYFHGLRMLSAGYYWSLADAPPPTNFPPAAFRFAHKIAQIAARFATFYTLDVAETADGDWILIEINDGQSAVPSEHDLDQLYGRLKAEVSGVQ
ncbi:ATP-grasp domain-containing protein [Blastopirellula retiformator]|uniref:ATP-grasp domain-containing protein n=1 Tax=Blastopirellula retiformator TaxID=2527970 RepID=A0A5C5UZT8_9BACT|nr:ATP-grasp domain-containing protein [Blastopirellula retiformator]TWT31896.1 hypothetical protein Enr8_38210 [Blastopirellula retiformator]